MEMNTMTKGTEAAAKRSPELALIGSKHNLCTGIVEVKRPNPNFFQAFYTQLKWFSGNAYMYIMRSNSTLCIMHTVIRQLQLHGFFFHVQKTVSTLHSLRSFLIQSTKIKC